MEKILIVDDYPANIRITAEMLKSKYKVLAANNGYRAIELAEGHLPDLVLLDIMMPELDGYSICKILKSNIKTADIPVIFITAKNEVEDIIRGFAVGGCDYITKPFKHEELFVRVNTHIELKRARSLMKKYIEELEIKNVELELVSKTDYLTGLANRRYMIDRLKEEVSRNGRSGAAMSILMCDIDWFKKINDTYGHEFGDLVIKEVTKSVTEKLRECDVASRWGGEEFLILLPETKLDGAKIAAEKIRKTVEENGIFTEKGEYRVSVTIGVTEYNDKITMTENINNADEALYAGKRDGRNRVSVFKG